MVGGKGGRQRQKASSPPGPLSRASPLRGASVGEGGNGDGYGRGVSPPADLFRLALEMGERHPQTAWTASTGETPVLREKAGGNLWNPIPSCLARSTTRAPTPEPECWEVDLRRIRELGFEGGEVLRAVALVAPGRRSGSSLMTWIR